MCRGRPNPARAQRLLHSLADHDLLSASPPQRFLSFLRAGTHTEPAQRPLATHQPAIQQALDDRLLDLPPAYLLTNRTTSAASIKHDYLLRWGGQLCTTTAKSQELRAKKRPKALDKAVYGYEVPLQQLLHAGRLRTSRCILRTHADEAGKSLAIRRDLRCISVFRTLCP